jgi:hypothetical protein
MSLKSELKKKGNYVGNMDDYGFFLYKWFENDLMKAVNNKQRSKKIRALTDLRKELLQQPAK